MLQLPTKHALWVVEYGETDENELTISLIEAKISSEVVHTEFGSAHPIYPDESSSVFTVTWSDYVAFAVRNESFALPEEGAALGYGLGKKAHSHFRTYVAASTFADDEYPGPLTHWFLNAERHCFDVISANAPGISELAPEEAASVRARYRQGR
ncbi:MAG: hypothetical protein WC729_22550 [Sphingomonas sp.]|jgi:hypothetical protein|uniref:hypothetical protein n=1 Tax=Sphingomonas sp. TaxID=28214 RepID=UPI003563298E